MVQDLVAATLWVAILVEALLLFMLYRHVGIVTGTRPQGLPVDSRVAEVNALSANGQTLKLAHLLVAQVNLFVFGSRTCAGCRTLLLDASITTFIAQHGLPSYFLEEGLEPVKAEKQYSMPILTVTKEIFDSYRIPSTPFVYLISSDGLVLAQGSAGTGLQALAELVSRAGRSKALNK